MSVEEKFSDIEEAKRYLLEEEQETEWKDIRQFEVTSRCRIGAAYRTKRIVEYLSDGLWKTAVFQNETGCQTETSIWTDSLEERCVKYQQLLAPLLKNEVSADESQHRDEIMKLKERIAILERESATYKRVAESSRNPPTTPNVGRLSGREGECDVELLLRTVISPETVLIPTNGIARHTDFTLIYYSQSKIIGYALIDVKNYRGKVGIEQVRKLERDIRECTKKYHLPPVWASVVSLNTNVSQDKTMQEHVYLTEDNVRIYLIHSLKTSGSIDTIRRMVETGNVDVTLAQIVLDKDPASLREIDFRNRTLETLRQEKEDLSATTSKDEEMSDAEEFDLKKLNSHNGILRLEDPTIWNIVRYHIGLTVIRNTIISSGHRIDYEYFETVVKRCFKYRSRQEINISQELKQILKSSLVRDGHITGLKIAAV